APEPVPFDNGPVILVRGSPRLGMLLFGSAMLGGILIVGSTASLGCSFTASIGGVIGVSENLGSLPLGACTSSCAPPPPPIAGPLGAMGRKGEISTAAICGLGGGGTICLRASMIRKMISAMIAT